LPLKIGFGLSDDVKRLHAKLGIRAAGVVDLSVALRTPGQRNDLGAKTAVAKFFGLKLQKSKKISTTNWAMPRLNEKQILYAADDAQVALRVYRHWIVWATNCRRSKRQTAEASQNRYILVVRPPCAACTRRYADSFRVGLAAAAAPPRAGLRNSASPPACPATASKARRRLFPRIAGKPAGYLYNQLRNFRDGRATIR
jgi:cytochrome c553